MDVIIAFLLIAAIISIGFFSNYFFRKTKIPELIWLLFLGLLIGPIFHMVNVSLFISIAPYFFALALLMILFDGGMNMNIYKMIGEIPRASLLSVLAFVFSMIVTALISFFAFNLSWFLSVLLGVIIGGTSSAIVVPTVGELKLRSDTSLFLDIESVITEPLCIIIALGLLATYSKGGMIGLNTVQSIISFFSIAIVLGSISGILWLFFFQKIKMYKYHYMLTLGFLFFLYSMVEALGGNGAVASLVMGLVLGHGKEFSRIFKIKEISSGLGKNTKLFHSQITFFVRTFFFVFLGAMVSLKRIDLFVYGVMLSLGIFLSRIAAVKIATIKSKFSKREKEIVISMFPRGLAAAVLASMPFLEYHIQEARIFPDIVFSVILTTGALSTLGIFLSEYFKNK